MEQEAYPRLMQYRYREVKSPDPGEQTEILHSATSLSYFLTILYIDELVCMQMISFRKM